MIPFPALAAMTLASAAPGPPIRLSVTAVNSTPSPPLGSGSVPLESVPIRLPWTSTLLAPSSARMPGPALPEITLSVTKPPEPPVMRTPTALSVITLSLAATVKALSKWMAA